MIFKIVLEYIFQRFVKFRNSFVIASP